MKILFLDEDGCLASIESSYVFYDDKTMELIIENESYDFLFSCKEQRNADYFVKKAFDIGLVDLTELGNATYSDYK